MSTNAHDTVDTSPDPAKAGKLAQQIVSILINEDLITRQRAVQAAMTLLGDAPVQPNVGPPHYTKEDGSGDSHDLASFFNRDGEMKPADYAYLCAAYHFSQFGGVPFSFIEIRAIAADAGVVIPDRLDMTFSQATKKGKKLFQSTGKGSLKPTAAGGLEFGERWGVRPGKKAKAP
ncbi:MAG: hypothetical protein QM780_02790 [Hyphomicrobium sp.]|uniref:hypothetical protein n=1 Tax=Hyphomicrobium sp. TaxID=82 RepID=UPI0039E3E862